MSHQMKSHQPEHAATVEPGTPSSSALTMTSIFEPRGPESPTGGAPTTGTDEPTATTHHGHGERTSQPKRHRPRSASHEPQQTNADDAPASQHPPGSPKSMSSL